MHTYGRQSLTIQLSMASPDDGIMAVLIGLMPQSRAEIGK